MLLVSGHPPEYDDIWHDSDVIVGRSDKIGVYFTREGAIEVGVWQSTAVEGDVQFPVDRVSIGIPRRDRTDQNESRLLPRELRHHHVADCVPEPALAPNLAHRLRRDDGRVALPLLPPRRAAGDLRPHDRRPRGADRALGAHDRFPLVDRRDVQYTVLAIDRGRGCVDSRRLEEDR